MEEVIKDFEDTLPKDNISNYDIPDYVSSRKKRILVLSGGGVRGIAHIGALQSLEEHHILQKIEIFAGTSIGGLVCSLLVVGYKPHEMYKFIKIFDLRKLADIGMFNLIESYGLDKGNRLELMLGKLLNGRGFPDTITMEQLYQKTGKLLMLTTTCVSDKQVVYLSPFTHPDLQVIKAIRMTTSLPIYFMPVIHKGKMYIDGGCFDNYPIHLFMDILDDTIGIYLHGERSKIAEIPNLETYLLGVMDCLMEGIAVNATRLFDDNTIKVMVDCSNIINYMLTDKEKDDMFMSGFKAAEKYISGILKLE
jgi:NTE family protein